MKKKKDNYDLFKTSKWAQITKVHLLLYVCVSTCVNMHPQAPSHSAVSNSLQPHML